MTFKARKLACPKCGVRIEKLLWDSEPLPACPVCLVPYEIESLGFFAKAHTVIGDEIDITVEHGICNPDGTPKRYTSKSDMRAAERALGLTNQVRHVGMPGSDKSPHTTRFAAPPWTTPEGEADFKRWHAERTAPSQHAR